MKFFKNQAGIIDIISITIIVGILGSIFITGVFVWKEIDNNRNLSNLLESVNQPVGNEVEEEKEIEDTEEWITYKNEELGFTFDYPESLNIIEDDGLIHLYAELPWPERGTSLKFSEVDLTVEQYIDEYNESRVLEDGTTLGKILSQEDHAIGGVDAVLLKGSTAIGATNSIIFVTNNDRNYVIGFFASAIDEELDILDSFKFVSFISEDNGPDTYNRYGEKLLLFGERTDFNARKFEEQGYILFVDDERSIKTIDIEEPYTQSILAENIEMNSSNDTMNHCKDIDELYLCEIWATGPGTGIDIFIFDPDTKEFIFVKDIIRGFGIGRRINFVSSFSDKAFYAKYTVDCGDSCPVFDLEEAEGMEIFINDKEYNMEQYLDNVDNIKTLFECNSNYDYSGISADQGTIDVGNFPPDKLDCYLEDELVGYFDFVNSEFVVE